MKSIASECSKKYHAYHTSGRRAKTRVHWIVLHDTEGGTAESVARYFTLKSSGGSAHLVVDDQECFRTLEPNEIPWGAASAIGANTAGFHIEQCGYAKWSAVIWKSHINTLRRAAYKTAVWAQYFKIPLVFVDATGLLAGHRGITTHNEVSKASRQKDPAHASRYTHSDPGPFWPRTLFMALVRKYAAELGYPPKVPSPVPPPVPGPSPFAGKGLLTAWNPAAALPGGGKFDWVAVQLDNETGASPAVVATLRNVGFKKVFGWEARASQEGVNRAKLWGLDGYIGQAESDPEAKACLALAPQMPKAVIGNATSWSATTFKALADRGWDFILEWYWNAAPHYTAPNAANYPYFVSVCFGCYDASGEQPDGRRVALADYRQIWKGSWCVYLGETMTDLDWAAV